MTPFRHQVAIAMITYTRPVAGNLPTKTLVARQLQINTFIQRIDVVHMHSLNCPYAHSHPDLALIISKSISMLHATKLCLQAPTINMQYVSSIAP